MRKGEWPYCFKHGDDLGKGWQLVIRKKKKVAFV